ncbi:hypothetical protein BRC2024_KWYBBTRE_CDS_0084 [Acinetobacter phage vB_AbaM_AB-Navy-v2]
MKTILINFLNNFIKRCTTCTFCGIIQLSNR